MIDIQAKIDYIKENKVLFAENKIKSLENIIPALPDRQPTHKGNINMRQYLLSLKREIEKSPEKYANDEIQKLEAQKLIVETTNES